jgi:hypothetical protein
VSVALGMHGPNVGVSGGQHAVSEGLFTSISLLSSDPSLPGVWLVVSGWTREPSLDSNGKPISSTPMDSRSGPMCRALAVEITADVDAAFDAGNGRLLTLHMSSSIRAALHAAEDRRAADEILEFAHGLAAGPAASWSHACPWGAAIRLAPRATAAGSSQTASRGLPQREAA